MNQNLIKIIFFFFLLKINLINDKIKHDVVVLNRCAMRHSGRHYDVGSAMPEVRGTCFLIAYSILFVASYRKVTLGHDVYGALLASLLRVQVVTVRQIVSVRTMLILQ